MFKNFVSLFGCFIASSNLWAHSLETESRFGENHYSQAIYYSGKSQVDDLSQWLWNIDFQFARTTVTDDAVFTKKIIDRTFTGTFGFGYDSIWSGGVSFDFSRTPEEKLTNLGPLFYMGRKFDWKSLRLKASGGFESYTQDVESQPRRRSITLRRSFKFLQTSLGFFASLDPAEWLNISAGYIQYFYSRDIATLVNNLDSKRVIAQTTSGLSSTLSNFAKNSISTTFNFYPYDIWELAMGGVLSRLESEARWVKILQISTRYELFKAWSLGVGYERSFNGSSLDPDQNLYSAQIGFRF
ncbi:MAG: hypothetical protein J0L93_07580 [Deltaproteobacteria bacterium]|nr:hypothetical protein [Deltaproteobacteria bacterium]